MLPDYALLQAIRLGTSEGVDDAIARGASPHADGLDGKSALETAQHYGETEIGRKLIRSGADPDRVIGHSGDTLLHRCVRTGDTGFASLLLDSGANPNAANDSGKTPLHLAVVGDFEFLTKRLLEGRASVHRVTPQGDSPLHIAASHGSLAVVKALIQAGADPLLTNNTGYTALHEAAAAGKTDVVSLLIDRSHLGRHVKAALLPRVRRAAELHGHHETANAILTAEGFGSSQSPNPASDCSSHR